MMDEDKQVEKVHDHLEEYGDSGILSADAKVPTLLKWTYIILPVWGIVTLYFFWNGSLGWFDRGSWEELQQAANTTYPFRNSIDPS